MISCFCSLCGFIIMQSSLSFVLELALVKVYSSFGWQDGIYMYASYIITIITISKGKWTVAKNQVLIS